MHLPLNALGSVKLINASDKIVHIPGKAPLFLSFTQHSKKRNTFAFVPVKGSSYTVAIHSSLWIGSAFGAFKHCNCSNFPTKKDSERTWYMMLRNTCEKHSRICKILWRQYRVVERTRSQDCDSGLVILPLRASVPSCGRQKHHHLSYVDRAEGYLNAWELVNSEPCASFSIGSVSITSLLPSRQPHTKRKKGW